MQIITERRFREKKMSDQTSDRSICPHVVKPFEDCYCTSTNSLHTESTIHYCGGNFRDCEIYKKHLSAPEGE